MNIFKWIRKNFIKPKISFKGKNNKLIKGKNVSFLRTTIKIWGNNNKIILDDDVHIKNAKIILGFPCSPVENCVIKIGKKTGFNSLFLQIGEDNSTVIVGENCMCSYGIELNCTDTHSIFDNEGNLLNIGKNIIVGDNVWICKDVRIMKNTKIPNGCIVAQGSIVTKKFETENCIIAGNPARIVKENISWSHIRPNKCLMELNK